MLLCIIVFIIFIIKTFLIFFINSNNFKLLLYFKNYIYIYKIILFYIKKIKFMNKLLSIIVKFLFKY